MTWPLLSTITFLPLLGVLFILLRSGEDEAAARSARWAALWATLITFAVSLIILPNFNAQAYGFQLVESHQWLSIANYKMGVDGISMPFVLLTTFLMPICIGASWFVKTRVREYMIAVSYTHLTLPTIYSV